MFDFEIIQPLLTNFSGKSFPRIYRSRIDSDRYYYAVVDGNIVRLPSVTTVLQNVLPTEQWLIQWIARWGYERAMEKRNQAAHYGTLFSICAADFLKRGEFDLATIEMRIDAYRYANNIDFPTDFWNKKLREDLYSLASFVQDYQFQPLAIELPLFSTKYQIAGTIDAIGWMRIGTGQNGKILKRDITYDKDGNLKEDKTSLVLAIIDWKTGRHGFHRSQEAQLHMYRLLIEDNFPEINHPTKLFNWAPKEWNTEEDTKYTLKDQTASPEKDKILNYIAIYQVDAKQNEPTIKLIDGILKLGEQNGNLKVIPYKDLIEQKIHADTKQLQKISLTEENNKNNKETFDPSAVENFFNKLIMETHNE